MVSLLVRFEMFARSLMAGYVVCMTGIPNFVSLSESTVFVSLS